MTDVSEILWVILLSIPIAALCLAGAADIVLLIIVFVVAFFLVKGADR